MAKLYKAVVYVLDLEGRSPGGILYEIENSKYMSINAEEFKVADIGKWSDEHPANQQGCDYSIYEFRDVDEKN